MSYPHYLIFFTSFLPIFLISSSQITFELTTSQYGTYSIELCLGEDGLCDDFTIDFTYLNLKVFKNSIYNPVFNTTSNIPIDIFRTAIPSQTKSKHCIVDAEFDFISTIHPELKCIVGLSQQSLFLYNILEYVERKIFYIDINKLKLVFGDYPDQYYRKFPNRFKDYKYCPLISKTNPQYSCYIDSIYFKNEIYHIENTVDFNIGTSYIYVDKPFMDLIRQVYFAKYIKDNTCSYEQNGKEHFITCKDDFDYINEEGLFDIYVIMNKFSLRLTKNELFLKYDVGGLMFMIVYNEDNSNWIFGSALFKRHIVIIDQEHDQLGFIPYIK